MTKKNIFIIAPTILFLISACLSFYAYRKYSMDYIRTYVSSHLIKQRKQIKEDDLLEVLVPKEYLNDDIYLDKQDILNKYVKLSFSIPTGSLFYKIALEDNIKDLANTYLNENEVNYDIYTSEVKVNTGALNVDMNVDVYVTIKDKDKAISDLLLSNCRITGLYDNNGRLISVYDKDSRVNIISIAISNDCVNLLNKALKLADVNIIASSSTYNSSKSCTVNENSLLMSYLN